jgi:hypothetical protein
MDFEALVACRNLSASRAARVLDLVDGPAGFHHGIDHPQVVLEKRRQVA